MSVELRLSLTEEDHALLISILCTAKEQQVNTARKFARNGADMEAAQALRREHSIDEMLIVLGLMPAESPNG